MYFLSGIIADNRFYDNLQPCKEEPNCYCNCIINNSWALHSNLPLQESIEKYASFPIGTKFENKNDDKVQREPRLLVFSVDVSEGLTVTFDSYPKSDGSRKTEYGRYGKQQHDEGKEKGFFERVISYNDGITIDQVMASGTISVFYDYREIDGHKFWDGGYLSNTPLREVLDAHRQYWRGAENKGKIPDLDVYIVNLHPAKIDAHLLVKEQDRQKERRDDIIYGDRSSHYDEKMAHLLTDYDRFVTRMKNLVDEAIQEVNKKGKEQELNMKLETILSTRTISKDSHDEARKYEDLIRDTFNLNVVMRIERTNYINSTSYKTGDLTLETINKLIQEGRCDAWLSIIQKEINGMQLLEEDRRRTLTNKLDEAMQNLRKKDYEDKDSETYNMLSKFISELEKIDGSDRVVRSTKAFMTMLN
jgi:predicted acylesterase/phospholipase RssA